MERTDEQTGFTVRDDLCTGCSMCILACSSIKHDVFSFGQSHAFIAITPGQSAATFGVRFTEDCDGCTYCLSFCGFDAIEEPQDWVKPPHLDEIRRRHVAAKAARRREAMAADG